MNQRRSIQVATGSVGGVFGGGGGAVMIPLMTGVLRMPQHRAHGTSLVIIAGAATASAVGYAIHGNVDWTMVAALVAGSAIGAHLGARGARRLPAMRLRQLLAAFLACVAIRLFLPSDPLLDLEGPARFGAGSAIGLVGGLASGALGVGGGAIFVPAMVLLLGVDQHLAQGASICAIVPTAAIGALTHARLGTVDGDAARWIAPLAIPGGGVGSMIADTLSNAELRAIVAGVLVGVSAQMFITATRTIRIEARHPLVLGEVPRA